MEAPCCPLMRDPPKADKSPLRSNNLQEFARCCSLILI